MKKISVYFFAAFLTLGLASGCSKDDDNSGNGNEDGYGDVTTIVNDYVEKTVLPTYEDMKNKAWSLYDAVADMEDGVTPDKITAACNAWRATRIPWEQSEAFLFGPAAKQNLDPLLDSWPLDRNQIDNVIKGSAPISGDALGANVRGFHTIEYLIFENGQPRSTIGARELEYLIVVTELLRDDCIKLWSSWAGADVLEGRDADAMEAIEYEGENPSFAYQFKNAGKAGSVYLSTDEAIEAIVDGCVGIADEVGTQKIGGPNGSKNVEEVESWYSWNSITDYANNIESIRNSYLGGREGKRGNSLSAYVKERNADLDAEISKAIEDAHSAITSMQAPFRNNLTGAGVDKAMQACDQLALSFEKIKTLNK